MILILLLLILLLLYCYSRCLYCIVLCCYCICLCGIVDMFTPHAHLSCCPSLGWFLVSHHNQGIIGLWLAMSLAWLIMTVGCLYSVCVAVYSSLFSFTSPLIHILPPHNHTLSHPITFVTDFLSYPVTSYRLENSNIDKKRLDFKSCGR